MRAANSSGSRFANAGCLGKEPERLRASGFAWTTWGGGGTDRERLMGLSGQEVDWWRKRKDGGDRRNPARTSRSRQRRESRRQRAGSRGLAIAAWPVIVCGGRRCWLTPRCARDTDDALKFLLHLLAWRSESPKPQTHSLRRAFDGAGYLGVGPLAWTHEFFEQLMPKGVAHGPGQCGA